MVYCISTQYIRIQVVDSFMKDSSFLLVSSSALPEIFLKVVDAKKLLSTGQAHSAAEATRLVGISRSAFYKYKDCVYAYSDAPASHIISVHAILRDKPGVLMSLISTFYNAGANILTVNQNIPIAGAALVAVSCDVQHLDISVSQLLDRLRNIDGVDTIESISGN